MTLTRRGRPTSLPLPPRGRRGKDGRESDLAPRETRIGILIFFLALAAAAVIDFGSSEGSLSTLLSQTFVVMAWVALWGPAYRLLQAASYRLGRRYFAELAEAEISVDWD